MSCVEGARGFDLKSERGVYEALPPAAVPVYVPNLLLMDHDVRTRHAIMTNATKAITAPTIIKTKFSGRLFRCIYGAFCVGGTVGAG